MPSVTTLAPRFSLADNRLLGEDGRRLRADAGATLRVEQTVRPFRLFSELAQRLTTEAISPLVTEQLHHG